MQDPIASRKLICVRRSGQEVSVTMMVGKPYPSLKCSKCPVALEPLHKVTEICGEDSWQAIQLAMTLVESLLQFEVDKGSKLYGVEDDGTRFEYDPKEWKSA